MTRASLKTKYDPSVQSASSTLSFGLGDLKLKASCTDRTVENGLNLAGVSLGVEKPGFFIIDYDLPKQDKISYPKSMYPLLAYILAACCTHIFDVIQPFLAARFQFMNSVKVYGKQLKLTYIHPQKANATVLETSLSFDSANKLTGKYSFLSGKGSVKYSYTHSSGVVLEPSFDFHTEAWSFGASQKLGGGNALKASYETSRKVLDLEWTGESKEAGFFKVSCTINSNEKKPPKMTFEKTWNLDF